MPLVHRFGAPHELRPPVRCQYPHPSSLRPRLPPNSSHLATDWLSLCSSLTETLPLHSYCKQTLRYGKLQDALAGLMLGSSGPRLASRRLWWYLQVDRSSSGRARPTHIGGLEVWVNHLENRPISLASLLFEYMKADERTSSAPKHRVDAPRELRPPV